MLWVVAGLFAISWLPYHTVSLYLNFVSDNDSVSLTVLSSTDHGTDHGSDQGSDHGTDQGSDRAVSTDHGTDHDNDRAVGSTATRSFAERTEPSRLLHHEQHVPTHDDVSSSMSTSESQHPSRRPGRTL